MNKLTLIDKAFFLKKTPLFANFDLDLLLTIADKLQIVSFEAGTTVFSINEDAYRMYFIIEGSIAVRESNGNIMSTLHPGDFFGDESLFSGKPRAYEAISKTPAVLMSLSRPNLLTIISEYPAVAIGLLQAYTSMTTFRKRKKDEG